MATAGDAPGHQSVVVRNGVQLEVIVGQCCYTCGEFTNGDVFPGDRHDVSTTEWPRSSGSAA